MTMQIYYWIGILFCLSQSAMFSGLNLAFFSISRLRLEVEKKRGNQDAEKIMQLRADSNFLLTTILWGNVGINVLLTLLSNQVLAGVGAFLFSTVFITLIGEIAPQAYFSRHAMRFAAMLSPVLKTYQILLYPVSRPTAHILDLWLGKEGIHLYKEKDLAEVIKLHISSDTSDIDHLEGRGALNFLALDDLSVIEEGETVDPKSIIVLDFKGETPLFPVFTPNCSDHFLQKIQGSNKKWVVLVNQHNSAQYVLDSDAFLRAVFFNSSLPNPMHFCHRPILVSDPSTSLEEVICQLKMHPHRTEDDVIDHDIILLWGDRKKVITGADILGRLLKGIVNRKGSG